MTYEGDADDRADVRALCERFGLEMPEQYRKALVGPAQFRWSNSAFFAPSSQAVDSPVPP